MDRHTGRALTPAGTGTRSGTGGGADGRAGAPGGAAGGTAGDSAGAEKGWGRAVVGNGAGPPSPDPEPPWPWATGSAWFSVLTAVLLGSSCDHTPDRLLTAFPTGHQTAVNGSCSADGTIAR
jgi:hypothetical protein